MSGVRRVSIDVDGVHVEGTEPGADRTRSTPILCVHGGCHASWCWDGWLEYFATHGRPAYALDWYHHGRSRSLAPAEFVQRSIGDVCEEIGKVIDHLGTAPVLIGHSMGGLAVQAWAAQHTAAALVLLTPAAPAQVGGAPIELPFALDETMPFAPPPLAIAREMFFHGVPVETAERLHARLCAESPRAVLEATRHILSIDTARVTAPMLVFAGELDFLTPPDLVARLARHYGADYTCLPGRGHSVLVEPGWRETAAAITTWLDGPLAT
ncbi:MAG: alpha/beta hydrolase [Gammaproteobacteria bacterium]|nr:alpha/beta hydrolase [Gammaproteobacteria bacterium]